MGMRAPGRRGRTFIAGAVTVGAVLAGAPARGADDTATPEPEPPSISIEGSDSLTVELSPTGDPDLLEPSTWPWFDDDLSGSARVVLNNTGPDAATVTFSIVVTDPSGGCEDETPTFTPADPVEASSSRTYDLSVTMDSDCVGQTALLVVTGTGVDTGLASEPKTADIALARHIGGQDFGPPLVVAGIVFLLFLIGAGLPTLGNWTKRTPGGDAWSFSGSWLTSVSAIGTALGGVLAASGFVTELLPGIPLGNFLGLSLTFGGLIVAAPMVFALGQTVDWKTTGEGAKKVKNQVVVGRIWGLVGAGACTCAAVAGLLTMLAVLTTLSIAGPAEQVAVLVLLLLVAGVVAAYVVIATRNAYRMRTDPNADDPGAGIPRGLVATPTEETGQTGTL